MAMKMKNVYFWILFVLVSSVFLAANAGSGDQEVANANALAGEAASSPEGASAGGPSPAFPGLGHKKDDEVLPEVTEGSIPSVDEGKKDDKKSSEDGEGKEHEKEHKKDDKKSKDDDDEGDKKKDDKKDDKKLKDDDKDDDKKKDNKKGDKNSKDDDEGDEKKKDHKKGDKKSKDDDATRKRKTIKKVIRNHPRARAVSKRKMIRPHPMLLRARARATGLRNWLVGSYSIVLAMDTSMPN